MRRAAVSIVSLAFAGIALLSSPSARSDDASAPALNAAESVCVGQNVGSACHSSTMVAGGTCLPGCCGHLDNGPQQPPVYSNCLACSDTSGMDPDFTSMSCEAGGGTVVLHDAGIVVIFDGGTPPTTPSSSSSSGGCSAAGLGRTTSPAGAGLLLGLAALVATRRRRVKA